MIIFDILHFQFYGQILVDVKEEESATVTTFKYQLPFFIFFGYFWRNITLCSVIFEM